MLAAREVEGKKKLEADEREMLERRYIQHLQEVFGSLGGFWEF